MVTVIGAVSAYSSAVNRAVVLYVDLRVVGAVQQPVVGCIFMLSAKQQYACDDQRGDEDDGDDNQRPVGFLFGCFA